MKNLLFIVLTFACALFSYAEELSDTTRVTTLEDIIATETKSKTDNDIAERQRDAWGKNTYLNISLNKTEFSSEEFPSTNKPFAREYDSDLSVGLQFGHTFNFHKNPIGSVLFIGLDYTWTDLNYSTFKEIETPKEFQDGDNAKVLPWHHKKTLLSYGMSVGPSMTFYPFTSMRKKGTDKIRLQLYFHVGYNVQGAIISKVNDNTDIKDQWAWGHGLYTAFGGNISWNFIGVGYEIRNDNSLNFKAAQKVFDTGKMKAKENTSRFYLQFRF